MPSENKGKTILPKEIGITSTALMHILSLEDSQTKFEELLNNLQVNHLYVYVQSLQQLLSTAILTDNNYLLQLFENDTLIFFGRERFYADEMIALQKYLDNFFPDNWGVVVYTVNEYITGRALLGKEDLYNIGGNNIYVG